MEDSHFKWIVVALLGVIALSLYSLSGMAAVSMLRRQRLGADPFEAPTTREASDDR